MCEYCALTTECVLFAQCSLELGSVLHAVETSGHMTWLGSQIQQRCDALPPDAYVRLVFVVLIQWHAQSALASAALLQQQL